MLVAHAIANIFGGSGMRAMNAFLVLALALTLAWIALASLGRAATLKALSAYFWEPDGAGHSNRATGWSFRSLLGLNFLRAAATIAATTGLIGAFVVGGSVSTPADPAPGAALLIFLTTTMLVGAAWSLVNWLLTLAAVFVVVEGDDTFGAITASVNLCRRRPGAVLAVGTWFGLAHIVAFVVATTVVAFPMGLAPVFPPSVVLGGILGVTLLYFASADFLHIGRLAAYVAILQLPEAKTVTPAVAPPANLP